MSEIQKAISSLPGISLSQLAAVDFDSRVDTKFIFHSDLLIDFLEKVSSHLVVLEVNSKRIFDYENLYCDDSDFYFFKRHHSGFGNRSKVRVRKYSDFGPYFFEVKNKTNKGKTEKYRIPLERFEDFKSPITTEILIDRTGFSFEDLSKHTSINYKRVTLSNKELTEKITIDFQMNTKNETNSFEYTNLVIVEVKQINYSSKSPFISALKELKIYNSSFSKYCTSVALLNDSLKKNRFLPIIKYVNKIARA